MDFIDRVNIIVTGILKTYLAIGEEITAVGRSSPFELHSDFIFISCNA